jgi:hypothetical protein
MKSQQDFQTLNEYRDYLRNYYAGVALNALITDIESTTPIDHISHGARVYAVALVKELYGDWT